MFPFGNSLYSNLAAWVSDSKVEYAPHSVVIQYGATLKGHLDFSHSSCVFIILLFDLNNRINYTLTNQTSPIIMILYDVTISFSKYVLAGINQMALPATVSGFAFGRVSEQKASFYY